MIKFTVDGNPVPQGSMKIINGHILHSQGSALAVWRSSIALAGRFAGAKPVEGAIGVEVTFKVRRPKTVIREHPTVAPDLDKYVRGLLDALTGIAYNDDSQVVEVIAKKIYADNAGADIKCYEIVTKKTF
jgi:crossover junction endodeoxyribonuclease RusA